MIYSYSACIAGPYHIDNNIPCQDARFIKKREDGVVFAACADGLGSMLHSDIGSKMASNVAVAYCADNFTQEMTENEVKKLMKVSFVNAYKSVLEKAAEMNEDGDEFDTTLCLVIYDGETVWYGQSGDSGLIVRFSDGRYEPITVQQRDDDGCVFPLCSGPEYWVFGRVEGSVSAVMLMTDGVWEQICHPLLKDEDVKINTSLIKPFMERTEMDSTEIECVEKSCIAYLENYPRDYLNDDKTVVVLYNTDNLATEMPIDYYSIPDWDALQKKKMSFFNDASDNAGHTFAKKTEEPKSHQTGTNDMKVSSEHSKEKELFNNERGCSDDEIAHLKNENKPPARDDKCRKLNNRQKRGERCKKSNPSRSKRATQIPITKRAFDIVSLIILLCFSIFAFFMHDLIREYATESYFCVLLVCFLANASVLLPAPSILIVVQYSLLLNPTITAICGAFGAALGEMIGYFAGAHCGNLLAPKIHQKLFVIMPKHPYLTIFCFSVIPLPVFDLVGLISGTIKLNRIKFFLTCLAGKLMKMLSFAWLASYITKVMV